ncbi:hypothetical protein FQN51_001144 [Onygenales sp. PD_10]|nr:hypothetical protein FQN51_001144 [Onygenales sp. PD_10]
MPFPFPLNRRFRLLISSLIFILLVFYFFNSDGDLFDPSPIPQTSDELPVVAVVAGLRNSKTAWFTKYFPHWDVNIYIADDESPQRKIPKNKGREAMVYLTHMIDHYNDYSDNTAILFLHADRDQWHNDDEKYGTFTSPFLYHIISSEPHLTTYIDGKRMLQRFNTAHLLSEGYVNLRCHPYPGCTTGLDLTIPPTGKDVESATVAAFIQNFATLFPNSPHPSRVAVGCCAQFAVTAGTMRQNPRERYEELRRWLLDTKLVDHINGRVMEYMWHILFGKPAEYCPDPLRCYCEVYGRCDLKCVDGDCGVYTYPFGAGRSLFNKIKDYLGI